MQVHVPCQNDKCTEGCFCKIGFFRNRKNGPCVKKESCPKFTNDSIDNQKTLDQLTKEIFDILESKEETKSDNLTSSILKQ